MNAADIEAGRAALASIEAAWNAAGRAWDADALAAVYTGDAMLFGGTARACDWRRTRSATTSPRTTG